MKLSFMAVADERLLLSSRADLVRRARRLVGPIDAEDVVHDAFERALRARTLHADRDPRPWLDRITRNVAYDALRSRKRLATPPAQPDAVSAEHIVLERESVSEIDGALQTLPPSQRRTIVLHDLEGYSNAEIASLNGVPFHTVRTRLFRARRAMRDALAMVAA